MSFRRSPFETSSFTFIWIQNARVASSLRERSSAFFPSLFTGPILRGSPFISAKARPMTANIIRTVQPSERTGQRKDSPVQTTAVNRLTIAPPKLYSMTGIFPFSRSGGTIRHWPPVPARFSFLNCTRPSCLIHIRLKIRKELNR